MNYLLDVALRAFYHMLNFFIGIDDDFIQRSYVLSMLIRSDDKNLRDYLMRKNINVQLDLKMIRTRINDRKKGSSAGPKMEFRRFAFSYDRFNIYFMGMINMSESVYI
jgi:hypothetical protein